MRTELMYPSLSGNIVESDQRAQVAASVDPCYLCETINSLYCINQCPYRAKKS
jgi:hypothetical protein